MLREDKEEALELIGILEEKKDPVRVQDVEAAHLEHPLTREQIERLRQEGWITVEGDRIRTTRSGRDLARQMIRRHRLAERLMTDVLVLKDPERIETSACDLEHVLGQELTDSICTLLGHPAVCPHGKPIPPGACCSERRTEVRSLIAPLSELQTGQEGVIAYISTRDHARLDQLCSMGLFPGTRVKVHQRRPALVILFEETTLALDQEIAREIHVRRA